MENLTKEFSNLLVLANSHMGVGRSALNNYQLFLKQQKVGEIRPFVDNILIINLLLCSERLSAHGLDRQKQS